MSADIRESDAQFRAAWQHFANRLPDGKEAFLDGIHAVFGGVPVPFFNVLFLEPGTKSRNDFSHRLHDGTHWAKDQDVPWLLCVRDDDAKHIEDGQEVLQSAGFHPILPFTGMIADAIVPSVQVLPNLD